MTGLIDDNVPRSVRKWTLQTVEYLVESYPKELNWLDYKETLTPHPQSNKKDEHRDSIRRTVASMANGCEGYLVFGIKDKGEGWDRIVGIDPKTDLTRDFGHIIAEITPRIPQIEEFLIPFASPYPVGRAVWVVRIFESRERPHMSAGQYPKRGVGGAAAYLTEREVRNEITARELRHRQPRLLRHLLQSWLPLIDRIRTNVGYTNERIETAAARRTIEETLSLLSDDLVQRMLRLITEVETNNRSIDRLRIEHPKGPTTYLTDPALMKSQEIQSNLLSLKSHTEDCLKALEQEHPTSSESNT